MGDLPFDAQERLELCVLFDELGPSAPTLLEGWTAHDLAAHIVLRERDLIAGPCLVLPGRFRRFAEQRRVRLTNHHDFAWLVAPDPVRAPSRVLPHRLGPFVSEPERVLRAPRGREKSQRARSSSSCARPGRGLVAERSTREPFSESAPTRSRARNRMGRRGQTTHSPAGRAQCSTERYARRTAPLCVRATGCRPSGGQRDRRSGGSGSSHALRYVSRLSPGVTEGNGRDTAVTTRTHCSTFVPRTWQTGRRLRLWLACREAWSAS